MIVSLLLILSIEGKQVSSEPLNRESGRHIFLIYVYIYIE